MAGLCALQSHYNHHLLRLSSDLCTSNVSNHDSRFKLRGGLSTRRRRNTTTLNISCSNVNTDNGYHPCMYCVCLFNSTDDNPLLDFSVTSTPIHFLFFLICWDTVESGRSRQLEKQCGGTKRREVLLQGVFAAGCSLPLIISTPVSNSVALGADSDAALKEDDFRVYSDDVNKFQILIPRDWQVGNGEGNGIKSLTAFYPQETSNSNVSIVITGLGADFTRLESFGKVDAFAENLVSGLDRSWQRPPGVAAKLIDSKAANGLYYIEYTLQNPGESRRHLFSVLGIANNGWYNRLYTLTGQFVEEEAEKYGSTIEKAVASFRLV